MPDISKITLPDGVTYDIKDTVARQAMGGGINLIEGETTTPLQDGSTTNPIIVDGESYTAKKNDAVFYGNKELVFDGAKWHEFGDMTGLGALAQKDSASGSYTPNGTITGGAVSLSYTTVNSINNVGSLPTLTATVENEILTIAFNQGSLPTKGTDTSVATGVQTFTQPTFSGT